MKLTAGTKLYAGVFGVLCSVLILGLAALGWVRTLGGQLDAAVNGTARRLSLIVSVHERFQDMRNRCAREQLAYAILNLEKGSAAAACSSCHTVSEAAASGGELEAEAAAVQKDAAELARLLEDGDGRRAAETLGRGAASWAGFWREYLALAGARKFTDAHSILTDKMFPLLEEVDRAADLLSKRENAGLGASDAKAQGVTATARWSAFLLIGLNLGVAGALLWLVYKVTRTFRAAIGEMRAGTVQVAEAAEEVNRISQALSQGATEQAASIEETSATSDEIGATAQQNSQSSLDAAGLAGESQSNVDAANRAIEEMVRAMGEIEAHSRKIAHIIQTIDEIAFQTNILALNAAVEAARAGEAGMGFAVVADEVRSLAQRASQAARDTGALIQESIQHSHEGKSRVEKVAGAMAALTDVSARIKVRVEEVSARSQEQNTGIRQIMIALRQIGTVTQTTAERAEQGATASQQLQTQAGGMREVVGHLQELIIGSR
ncbi:MAG: hypothetical protein KGN36_11085 [Acidobacteriota bacterium]|nr:hypothetical protein [Acidobacteriota bacterium]